VHDVWITGIHRDHHYPSRGGEEEVGRAGPNGELRTLFCEVDGELFVAPAA
jgi:hypothetical protein